MLITEQWPRFVLPIVRRAWFQRMSAVPSPADQVYGIENSNRAVEYSQGIGELGEVPEYNSSNAEGEPAAIPYDTFNPLYEKTFTHKEYAKGLAVERKLIEDDQTGMIQRRASTLGNAFGITVAKHKSSVFNNAFSSSYLGADGKALCATDHPSRPTDTSTTFSNKGTTALADSAVTATIQAGKRLTDDRGNEFPVFYDTLYVPIELEATAWTIVNSLNKSGTADNDANFVRSTGMKVVVDPYLSDANNWFMIDSQLSPLHLLFFWRVAPEMALDPASDYNLVARYRGYMRYSYGWDDWRFVYGHEVT